MSVPAEVGVAEVIFSRLEDPDEVEANARLIAAAPELKEAAAQLLWFFDHDQTFSSEAEEESFDEAWDEAHESLRAVLERLEEGEDS